MLKELAIITIAVSNLTQVEEAWQEHFGYEVSERGTVSPELAELWDAEAALNNDFVLMHPANQASVYVRFVANDAASDYRPMTSHGWNATELLVKDTDAVAATLRDSAFDIVGEPKDLWPAPDAPRAMQAIGPGNELLYLTTNPRAAASLQLDETMPLVERPFIMVVGGPSMQDFVDFYGELLGVTLDDASPFKITMISKANELPMDTTYPLAIAATAPGYLIEFDELPATLGPRPVVNGQLPPGVAVVGFKTGLPTDEQLAKLPWVSPPRVMDEAPYNGCRAGIIRGPAGELIELVMK